MEEGYERTVAPVTLGIEVTEVKTALLAQLDFGDGAADLAGDESASSAGAKAVHA